MMLYPPMKDLLKQVPSRYELVNVVAYRARQIAAEADTQGYPLHDKPVTMAVREVSKGLVDLEGKGEVLEEDMTPSEEDVEEAVEILD